MERTIYKVNAEGQSVGRIATDIASHLIGKHKPEFQSHLDLGDIVHVENVAKMKVTGKKLTQKQYYSHSLHPGGIKEVSMGRLYAEDPAKLLTMAVARMLPKNKHQTNRLKRLQIK